MASAPSGKDAGVQRTSGFCSFQFSRGRVPGVGRPIVVPKPMGMVMSVHKRCVSVGGSRAFRPPRLFTGDRVQARLNPALSASHPVKMEPVLRSPSDPLTRPVALQEVVSSTASNRIELLYRRAAKPDHVARGRTPNYPTSRGLTPLKDTAARARREQSTDREYTHKRS